MTTQPPTPSTTRSNWPPWPTHGLIGLAWPTQPLPICVSQPWTTTISTSLLPPHICDLWPPPIYAFVCNHHEGEREREREREREVKMMEFLWEKGWREREKELETLILSHWTRTKLVNYFFRSFYEPPLDFVLFDHFMDVVAYRFVLFLGKLQITLLKFECLNFRLWNFKFWILLPEVCGYLNFTSKSFKIWFYP